MLTETRMFWNLRHELWLSFSINKSALLFWLLPLQPPSFSVTRRLNYFCQSLFFSLGELKTNPLISSIFTPLILQQPPSRPWLEETKLSISCCENEIAEASYFTKKKVCLDSGGASSGNAGTLADHHRTRDRKHACGLLWSLCIDGTTRIQSRRFLSIIDILLP